jgi:triacylglycerol lipase
MLKDQSLPELAVTMAQLASAAYQDDNKQIYADLGFKKYKFLDNEGAQGHVAASDSEVIVACRGTQPSQPNDLLADLDTIPKRHGKGWVHEGFRREARKILDQVLDWAAKNKGKDIYVTGHSLGAAMALYITQELEFAGYQPKKLLSFGQPRLGNADYVTDIKTEHYRFVNCNDMVTHVPPAALLFKHHGNLCYINFYGNIRPLSRYQRFKDSMRAHWRCWKKGQLFDGLYDHGMDHYIEKLTNIRDSGQSIN